MTALVLSMLQLGNSTYSKDRILWLWPAAWKHPAHLFMAQKDSLPSIAWACWGVLLAEKGTSVGTWRDCSRNGAGFTPLKQPSPRLGILLCSGSY